MTRDAFKHLPALRDKLIAPERSQFRVTPEVLARWDQRAVEAGFPARWRLSDSDREATRRATLGTRPEPADLWVYSYGSLMWDPGFHFDEVRAADLDGYQRRFTFRTRLGRGSPEFPALMLSLEAQQGRCSGLVFRIPAALVQAESEILWRREMIRGTYCPQMLPVATSHGEVKALVFAANPAHGDYVGELPLEHTAAVIGRACGMMGTNRDYLERLAAQLQALQVEDDYVRRLLEQVQRIGYPPGGDGGRFSASNTPPPDACR